MLENLLLENEDLIGVFFSKTNQSSRKKRFYWDIHSKKVVDVNSKNTALNHFLLENQKKFYGLVYHKLKQDNFKPIRISNYYLEIDKKGILFISGLYSKYIEIENEMTLNETPENETPLASFKYIYNLYTTLLNSSSFYDSSFFVKENSYDERNSNLNSPNPELDSFVQECQIIIELQNTHLQLIRNESIRSSKRVATLQ